MGELWTDIDHWKIFLRTYLLIFTLKKLFYYFFFSFCFVYLIRIFFFQVREFSARPEVSTPQLAKWNNTPWVEFICYFLVEKEVILIQICSELLHDSYQMTESNLETVLYAGKIYVSQIIKPFDSVQKKKIKSNTLG